MTIQNGTDNTGGFPSKSSTSLKKNTEVESGDSEKDMSIWSADRVDQLNAIARTAYTNKSSYDVAAGIVDMAKYPYPVAWHENEAAMGPSMEKESEVVPGDTGDAMSIWSADRVDQLNTICRSAHDVKSSYNLASGIADMAKYPFPETWHEKESPLGYSTRGEAVGSDGREMAGSGGFVNQDTGQVVVKNSVSGQFVAQLGVMPGVKKGESVENTLSKENLAIYFAPAEGGLAYIDQEIDKYHEIKYNKVEGKVTDATGKPVKAATIHGKGESVVTNAAGQYEMAAPIGTETTLVGLKKSKEKSVTLDDNNPATVDFQFSGLKIRVLTPDNKTIPGVPVEINGEQYKTDKKGEVVLSTLQLDSEHTVRAFKSDDFSGSVSVPNQEGVLTTKTIGKGKPKSEGGLRKSAASTSGIKVKILDENSNRPIRDADIKNEDSEYSEKTLTTEKGESTIIAAGINKERVEIKVADEDKRYKSISENVDISDGETTQVELMLKPRENITNS